jgi:hypothetical protein
MLSSLGNNILIFYQSDYLARKILDLSSDWVT